MHVQKKVKFKKRINGKDMPGAYKGPDIVPAPTSQICKKCKRCRKQVKRNKEKMEITNKNKRTKKDKWKTNSKIIDSNLTKSIFILNI